MFLPPCCTFSSSSLSVFFSSLLLLFFESSLHTEERKNNKRNRRKKKLGDMNSHANISFRFNPLPTVRHSIILDLWTWPDWTIEYIFLYLEIFGVNKTCRRWKDRLLVMWFYNLKIYVHWITYDEWMHKKKKLCFVEFLQSWMSQLRIFKLNYHPKNINPTDCCWKGIAIFLLKSLWKLFHFSCF